jgi:hypothetical protein
MSITTTPQETPASTRGIWIERIAWTIVVVLAAGYWFDSSAKMEAIHSNNVEVRSAALAMIQKESAELPTGNQASVNGMMQVVEDELQEARKGDGYKINLVYLPMDANGRFELCAETELPGFAARTDGPAQCIGAGLNFGIPEHA